MNDLFILAYYRGYNKEERMVVEATRSYCKHQMTLCSEEGMDIIFDIAQRLQDLHLSFEMIVVLKALCIFFTGRYFSIDMWDFTGVSVCLSNVWCYL